MKKKGREGFSLPVYILFIAVTLAVMLLCICVGSVMLPLKDTLAVLWNGLTGAGGPVNEMAANIILPVRLPRVLCVALVGASLSLCGGAMQ